MDDLNSDALEIPVTYRNENLLFPAQVIFSGYTHKIQVNVNDQLFVFEPDEERNYRAIWDPTQLTNGPQPDVALLQRIAAVLDSVIR